MNLILETNELDYFALLLKIDARALEETSCDSVKQF